MINLPFIGADSDGINWIMKRPPSRIAASIFIFTLLNYFSSIEKFWTISNNFKVTVYFRADDIRVMLVYKAIVQQISFIFTWGFSWGFTWGPHSGAFHFSH